MLSPCVLGAYETAEGGHQQALAGLLAMPLCTVIRQVYGLGNFNCLSEWWG